MCKYIFLSMMAVLLVSPALEAGDSITGRDVVVRYDRQIRASTEKVDLTMNLINKDGKARIRQLISISKTNEEGKQDSLLRFVEPADVRGTSLLTHEHADADDDRWLYLPALRKTRRVAATDDNDNFMGSDFTYEDIDFEELNAFNYKLLKNEIKGGADCYVVEATPSTEKKAKESGYSRRVMWIRKDNYFMIAVDYYNSRNELTKQRIAYDIKLVDGTEKWRPERQVMVNLKTGHKTELKYSNFVIGANVSNRTFSFRELTRGI
ncbi:MAG: outer membrane lipoprotein-sorting protein [Candidatus Thiodiazotropha sp.]